MKDVPQTQKGLTEWMENHPALSALLTALRQSQLSDPAHDLSHLLRVALWTLRLRAPSVPAEEAVAAALLHDFVNLPKNHPDRSQASSLAAEKARPLLAQAGFTAEAVDRIADAIRDHSYSRGAVPGSALGQALQDADRLEALGAIGLMRVFATGARMGTKFFHPEDPWARHRERDDLAYSLDHFFTKLLRLPATFHTEAGRAEALRRAQRLEEFLDHAAEEIGEPRK